MHVDREPEFLSVRETAHRLGVHENTVRNWVDRGILESARKPGARFHRFAAAEVERVRQARSSAVTTAQETRRIVGPELADATRLGRWADEKEAKYVFPRLVRRLLAATPGIEQLSARAGEGVSLGGWDIQAAASAPTPWLPEGSLAFELGVNRSPRAKAQSDYEKRSRDPLGLIPSETAYLFATPRRWRDASTWAAEREAEGVWREVRIIDGDDLEAWLEVTPPVHYWISEQIGLNPRGLITAERWWIQFSGRTRPMLPPEFLLAGRDDEREELNQLLAQPAASIVVKASWREDALAFICLATGAALDAPPTSPALVIRSPEVWDRVATGPGPATMIPDFDAADLGLAVANGKHVVVPAGAGELASREAIELPPPARRAACAALVETGMDFEQADRAAALARRSTPALMRRLAPIGAFKEPPWARPPTNAVFTPLLLAETWAESDVDHAAISALVGQPWPEIERHLRDAARGDDPPFVFSGTNWRLSSPEEAFEVLARALTSDDLSRWKALIKNVLVEVDPAVDLSPDERPFASLKGMTRRHSQPLREGLAEGLALMAAFGDYPLANAGTCADVAGRVTREILLKADTDSTGTIWRSLASELPMLAEAAPEIFLDSVLEGSRGQAPMLTTMFQDGGTPPVFGISSPHSGLLWALETLCWSEDYFLEGIRALAQLAAIDPGGRLSNRPQASLAAILVPWIRHTSASLERRIAAIDQIIAAQTDVGWQVIKDLWPSTHATSMPPRSPRYRDWKPDRRSVPLADWAAFVKHLVGQSIACAGASAPRWAELLTHVASVGPDERDRLLTALEARTVEITSDPSDRLLVWETLTNELERHRKFASADWAMDEPTLARLSTIAERIEPRDDVERYARLFDWHPDIGGVKYDDHEAHEAAAKALQEDAARQTVAIAGIEGLGGLAARSPVPRKLGWVTAQLFADDYASTLLSWLQTDEKRAELAQAWVQQRAITDGVSWVERTLKQVEGNEPSRLIIAFAAPPSEALWTLLDQISTELSDAYWDQATPMGLSPKETRVATRRLVEHGRPWAAVRTLAITMHSPADVSSEISPEIVLDILNAAAVTPPRESNASLGYELGVLLDVLDAAGTEAETLARLEWTFYQALEDYRPARALYKTLADKPELFVDLISRVFRGKNEPDRVQDEQAAANAIHAWQVLRHWRTVPGLRGNGNIDAQHLEHWVSQARLLLSDADRADIGDEQIGQLLSGSPHGIDGAWPAEPVRDLVERLGSKDLENGIHVGRLDRGVTSRDIYEGGKQERALVVNYQSWSDQTASHWPRTSRLLREIAASYEREAAREDREARHASDSG
jgi:Helix-turn-helix domain